MASRICKLQQAADSLASRFLRRANSLLNVSNAILIAESIGKVTYDGYLLWKD